MAAMVQMTEEDAAAALEHPGLAARLVAGYILVWAYAGVVVYVLVHAGKDLVGRLAWPESGASILPIGVLLRQRSVTKPGVPGIGPITALCFKATIDDPDGLEAFGVTGGQLALGTSEQCPARCNSPVFCTRQRHSGTAARGRPSSSWPPSRSPCAILV